MSSTNRSNARETHISDYYITPIEKIEEFLKPFISLEGNIFEGKKILDCCAGGDEINPMSYPIALNKVANVSLDNITTIDVREDSRANIKGNYLEMDCKDKFDVIITNPPFNVSLDIIKKALNDVKEGGYCIFLLRLNYFGSKARKPFWEENMAKYTFVHSQRICFTNNGKTDSIEYMHLVFKKGYKEEYTKLMVI